MKEFLPSKLTAMDGGRVNLIAGIHDGADQHERTAGTRGRDSRTLSKRGTSTGTSSGSWNHGTHHNATSSDASTSGAHTLSHSSTSTSGQLALSSLLNTGSSGTHNSWHQHTSNWQYQDQAATASNLHVDNLQTHVHLTHHDLLVM